MIVVAPRTIDIIHQGNLVPAQELSRSFSRELGFNEHDCEQIAIVVTELATNLIKHANGGTIKLAHISDLTQTGIQIESEDKGPGIVRAYDSLADGYSLSNGLGYGLGTVNRLMDDLHIISPSEGGTRIVCNRWVRPPEQNFFRRTLEFGVATRARQNEKQNGDTFVIKCWKEHALVGVIDGLGHGPEARKAAVRARNYIEDHFDQPLANIFKGVDRACQSTRGVVLALARFNLSTKTFQTASVGNIETRLICCIDRTSFVTRRGIVGMNAPLPVVEEHPWSDESILVMYSDGLHSHWGYNDFNEEIWSNPTKAAHTILLKQGKVNDDITLVIVKNTKDVEQNRNI